MESRFSGKRLSMPIQVLVWIGSLAIAYYVIPQGYAKVFDYTSGSQAFFESLGLSFGLMMTVGILELVAPVLMLIPRVSFYGAFTTFVIMTAAGYFTSWATTPVALAVGSLVIAFLMRPGILRKKPEVTTINV